MWVLRLFALIGVLAAAQPVAPVFAQDGAIATETGAAQKERDAAMATKIREIIHQLDGYADVTVMVSEGIVTLRGSTLDSEAQSKLADLVTRVEGVVAIQNDVTLTTDVAERLNPALSRFWERIKQAMALLPLLAVSLIAFALIAWIGIVIGRQRQPWDRLAPNAFIADIIRTLIRLAFLVFGVVVALDILGATALLSTILGAAGIIGLALGFAVRDTVENFIASLLLSVRQPFRPNDVIEIGGDVGRVIRLTSRATILLSFDGNHIRIPNATVFKSRIINYTRNRERRFQFVMKAPAGMDAAEAQEQGLVQLRALPFVLNRPAPTVWIDALGDDGASLCFSGWIDQHHTSFDRARGEAMRQVRLALDTPGKDPAPIAEMLDVAAGGDTDEETVLRGLVDTDREANRSNDLLTREGLDE